MRPHHAGHRQRLRERFLAGDPEKLADYELLELLLFSAIPRRDVKADAKRLLSGFGGLAKVLGAEAAELRRAGLGDPAIALLKAVHAASARLARGVLEERPVLSSWQALLDYCQIAMAHARTEAFRVLYLDRKNRLIADEVQQRGTVDQAPVYPREVMKRALELGASALILAHNHPSGDPTPSRADVEMTRQVIAAAEPLGIVIHDHIVVGNGKHASLKALGLI